MTGTSHSQALPTGDVTFLFTDIEGSTRLFRKDPLAMDAALAIHHEVLHDAIARRGGQVFQIIGDAFCAAFPQPLAAVEAALDAQRSLHAQSWPEIGEIRVRMGLHTAEAQLRGDTYPSSLTLVRVQRVMDAGHGGQTLLAESTAARVRDELPDGVTIRDMGPHRLRGLGEPEPIFQLVSADLPSEFPPLRTVEIDPDNPATLLDLLRSGVLVGREDELDQLRHHLARAMESRGHLVLLSGEPGVGKTRLARTVMDEAGRSGAVVLRGGCYEHEATTPYLPFVEAIREWVHWQPPRQLERVLSSTAPEIVRLAPEVEVKLGAVPANPVLEANDARLRLFDNIARTFESIAAPRGLVLFLDDLHWADESTLSLLHYLLRHLRASRVLIVGAYREVELDRRHPLATALVDWNRQQLTTRIPLGRLTREDTTALLTSLFGQEQVSRDFGDLLYAETEGNPFFVEESVKTLIEQGSIYRTSDGWERNELSEIAVPQSVKEAVGRRLNRLGDATVSVLHTAAALGKHFPFEELAAVEKAAEDDLLDALDEATAAQLVLANQDESYSFTHDKIREVLYEEINPIRRRRLHQRIGESLLALHGEDGNGHVQDVAYHFAQSGDLERSLRFSRLAADAAAGISAYDEAQGFLAQACEATEALGLDAELAGLTEQRGDLYLMQGKAPEAVASYERVLADVTGARAGVLHSKIGRSLAMSGDESGPEHLARAIDLLPTDRYPVEHANALTSLGRYYHYQAKPDEAIAVLEQALELARPTEDRFALSMIYAYLSGAYQHKGDHETSNRWARELIAFGEESESSFAVALGNEFLAENAFMAGSFEDAVRYSRKDREAGTACGALDRIAWSWFTEGSSLHGLGRLQEAWDASVRALEATERIGERRLATWVESTLSLIATERGDFETARVHGERGRELSDQLGQVVLQVWSRNADAYRLFHEGDVTGAANLLRQCIRLIEDGAPQVAMSFCLHNAVEVLVASGDLPRARDVLRMARENFTPDVDLLERAKLRHMEALIRLAEGDLASARRAIDGTVEAYESMGAMLWLRRTLELRAHIAETSGDSSRANEDRERARALREESGAGSA
jgi:class 3 adenylate cyclase/tetratricopeptide (TPR) repeat protein